MAQGLKSSPRGACREQLLRPQRPPAGPGTRPPRCPQPRGIRRRPRPPGPVLPARARRSGRGDSRLPVTSFSLGARRAGPETPTGPQPPGGITGAAWVPEVGSLGRVTSFYSGKILNKVASRGLIPAHFAPDAPPILLGHKNFAAPKACGSPAVSACVPHPSLETFRSGLPYEGVSHTCADQVGQFSLCVPTGP